MRTQQLRGTGTIDITEIERFERILKIRLNETLKSIDRLGDETRSINSDSPKDAGDRCIMSVSKESLFHQSGERRVMVRTIEAALARIQRGTFGSCMACGDVINARRLEALPWTRYCLRCQKGFEQRSESEYRSDCADRRRPLRKAG